MAVDLCRDGSNKGLGKNMNFSPRLSFSHDLNQSDLMPPIQSLQSSLLNYDFDFDFCVSKRSCDGESSLADELFADGLILPIDIKNKKIPHSIIRSTPSSPLRELPKPSVPSRSETEEEKQGNNSKSFWQFTRSKSSNCGSIYKRGLLWPLPLLSRSKSTGSTTTSDNKNNNSQNESHFCRHAASDKGSLKSQKNSSSSQQNHQKPPLKKSYGSSPYRVNPVINVPTEKLLGLASIFSHGKDKSKKK